MTPLSRQSIQVLDFLRDLYAQQDVSALATQIVESLPRILDADITSFNEVDPRTGHSRTIVAPVGEDRFPGSEEIFERHVREHPYVVHVERFRDGAAHRLSDFIDRAEFHRLPIYNEYYRRIGTEHQLAIALPWTAPLVRGVALSRRTRDYSGRERELLTTLGPHMVQAYGIADALARARRPANHAAGTNHGAPAAEVEVVLLSTRGTVQFATPRARRWFASYFGGSSARDARLPAALARWLRVQWSAPADRDGVPQARGPLVVARNSARLEIRLAADTGHHALLVRERCCEVSPRALGPLGLSPREAEVLAWVVEGKTNGEIGIILGARPRTVAKHLERIFRKLGVETRTAAAASALNVVAS